MAAIFCTWENESTIYMSVSIHIALLYSILTAPADDLAQNDFGHQQTDTMPTTKWDISWWRNQMETFSALLAFCAGNSPVSGEFPAQRPVTRSFDVFFDLRLNRQLSKQWGCWWFETPPRSLWRHCNVFSGSQWLIIGHNADGKASSVCLSAVVLSKHIIRYIPHNSQSYSRFLRNLLWKEMYLSESITSQWSFCILPTTN